MVIAAPSNSVHVYHVHVYLNLVNVFKEYCAEGNIFDWYQEVRWYFLVRDGAGLKWPPVHKV